MRAYSRPMRHPEYDECRTVEPAIFEGDGGWGDAGIRIRT